MTDMIRTFIAIELDDATRRALGEAQARLKRDRAASYVRWVAPENVHVTLKFLGEVAAERVPELQNAAARACGGIAPFALTITGAGAFPNTRRPNNVWIGVEGDVAALERLAQRVEDACAALGYAREERPFTAHLTLGRVKRDASPSDRQFVGKMIEQAQVGKLGVLRVTCVSVMRSELRPGGSAYSRLAEIGLMKDG
ncbi:MAG: RNA 2',3'-cyclic phosphodiesterase [Chloroflexi bacterium]|nr:RNA 2',3'-cyclic phosphodiesterase [Chloroflexota bacterium]